MEMGLQSKEVRIPKIQNSIQKNLRIDHTKSDGGDEFKSNYAKEVARCWDASSSSEDDFPQVNGTPNIIGTVEIHNQNELEQPFIIGERRTELNRVGHHHRTNSQQQQQPPFDVILPLENVDTLLMSRDTSHSMNINFDHLNLRHQCQRLIAENRHLLRIMDKSSDENLNRHSNGNTDILNDNQDIEIAMMDSYIDRIQWQLHQIESSRNMYRGVMEEVVKFLERCQLCLDSVDLNNTPRSNDNIKLENIDFKLNNSIDKDDLIKERNIKSPSRKPMDYKSFSDFTLPKVKKQTEPETYSPKKLAIEAFQLMRTAQNLLKTNEPQMPFQPIANYGLIKPDKEPSRTPSPKNGTTQKSNKSKTPPIGIDNESGFNSLTSSLHEVGIPLEPPSATQTLPPMSDTDDLTDVSHFYSTTTSTVVKHDPNAKNYHTFVSNISQSLISKFGKSKRPINGTDTIENISENDNKINGNFINELYSTAPNNCSDINNAPVLWV